MSLIDGAVIRGIDGGVIGGIEAFIRGGVTCCGASLECV